MSTKNAKHLLNYCNMNLLFEILAQFFGNNEVNWLLYAEPIRIKHDNMVDSRQSHRVELHFI